jgi:dTDP-4-amino-4,6-dideoxygalactose transaminase
VQKALNEENIFPRRYFYPSLNTINYVAKIELPISEGIASRILCLPLFMNLDLLDVSKIVSICNLYQ